MKRKLSLIAAVWLALLCTMPAAVAEDRYLRDDTLFTTLYDCDAMPDGGVALTLSQRDRENHSEGENDTVGLLVCLDAAGKPRWEVSERKPGQNIYASLKTFEDGTLLAMYHHYGKDIPDDWTLHRFTADGELLDSLALAAGSVMMQRATKDGMLLVTLEEKRDEADALPLHFTLYDADLKVLWELRDEKRFAANSMPLLTGFGTALLGASRGNGPAMLWLLDDTGKIVWEKELAAEPIYHRSLALDEDGNLLLITVGSDKATNQPVAPSSVTCYGADGSELWRTWFALPGDGKPMRVADSLVTKDGYRFLCTAQTDTRLRLIAVSTQGEVLSSVDCTIEEGGYQCAEMVMLNGVLHAAVELTRGGKEIVALQSLR
ncbi:MAG: hypothetical protein RR065_03510 [Clostridia bacterium]